MYRITIQQAADKALVPDVKLMRQWARATLKSQTGTGEITIRVVDSKEMTQLNKTYRRKSGPTNVLSFPFTVREGVELIVPLLGDVVICAEVVREEALTQHKSYEAHFAHMIVHGTLHLLGFDHVEDEDALKMEALEIKILEKLKFPNPYENGEDIKHYD